jgi:hypothetical protein
MAETYLKGLDDVMKNLNKEIQAIEGRTGAGLLRAAIIVRRAMSKESPKIPVDTSNLEHSFFMTVKNVGTSSVAGTVKASFTGAKSAEMQSEHASVVAECRSWIAGSKIPLLIIGFSANYALFVHENIEADFTSERLKYDRKTHKATTQKKRPGAGAKFFEAHLNANRTAMLQEIKDSVQIKD